MKKIEEIYKRIKENNDTVLGYPLSKDFDYSEFAPFLNLMSSTVKMGKHLWNMEQFKFVRLKKKRIL